jgi:hypothetical protein
MNYFIVILAFFLTLCSISSGFLNNPLKMLNKCISDKECKPLEYCEHSGINPFGSCHPGKDEKQSCVFDRHCKSKGIELLFEYNDQLKMDIMKRFFTRIVIDKYAIS